MCTDDYMACFLAPLVAGIIASLARRLWRKSEKEELEALELMLIGGSIVLMVEHAWSGELSPYPPFLTAMRSPGEVPVMLHEVSVVGGLMTLAVVLLWLGIVYASKLVKIKAVPLKRIITILGPR